MAEAAMGMRRRQSIHWRPGGMTRGELAGVPVVRGFLMSSDYDVLDAEAREAPDTIEFFRADGGCLCDVCCEPYRNHPDHLPFYCLTVLCDGSVVKL